MSFWKSRLGLLVRGQAGIGIAAHPAPLQQRVHGRAAVAAAVGGADGVGSEEGGEEVVGVHGVGLPAQEGEGVVAAGDAARCTPARSPPRGGATEIPISARAVADLLGHAAGRRHVGPRGVGHEQLRLEAAVESRLREQPPRRGAIELQVRRAAIVAPERRRQGIAGGLPVAAQGPTDELPAVDRAGERLADAHVLEGRALVVDAEEGHVQADPGVERELRVLPQATDTVLAHRRADVDLAGPERGDERGLVGQPAEDEAPQARGARPVVGVRLRARPARRGTSPAGRGRCPPRARRGNPSVACGL